MSLISESTVVVNGATAAPAAATLAAVGSALAVSTSLRTVVKDEVTASICDVYWSLASVLTCSTSDSMLEIPSSHSSTALEDVGSMFLRLLIDVSSASTEPQTAGLSSPHPTRSGPSRRVVAAVAASRMDVTLDRPADDPGIILIG
jgi:hypothetical protein